MSDSPGSQMLVGFLIMIVCVGAVIITTMQWFFDWKQETLILSSVIGGIGSAVVFILIFPWHIFLPRKDEEDEDDK